MKKVVLSCIFLASCQVWAQEVSITKIVGYGEGDNAKIIGVVQNDSDQAIEYAEIVTSLYDENKTFLDTGSTYSSLDVILPGESSPFELYVLGTSSFDTFDYQVQYEATSSEAVRDIDITAFNISKLGDNIEITGQAENIGTETREYVEIIFDCYTPDGDLAGVGSTYTTLDTLGPGQSSPFEGYILSPVANVSTCNGKAQAQ